MASGSIPSSAAPKHATTWVQHTEEEEGNTEEDRRLVLQAPAPPQTQPLAGDARGDDSDDNDLESCDDNDYEGLDSRAAVGEQSFEEETAQAERQHQGEDSEAEEIAFKLKVAAIARKEDKQIRYGKKPYHRFRSAVGGGGTAVGGGGAAALLVHNYALQVGAGIEFTLDSLCAIDESGHRFVAVQNNLVQGSKFDLLERKQEAFRASSQGG